MTDAPLATHRGRLAAQSASRSQSHGSAAFRGSVLALDLEDWHDLLMVLSPARRGHPEVARLSGSAKCVGATRRRAIRNATRPLLDEFAQQLVAFGLDAETACPADRSQGTSKESNGCLAHFLWISKGTFGVAQHRHLSE